MKPLRNDDRMRPGMNIVQGRDGKMYELSDEEAAADRRKMRLVGGHRDKGIPGCVEMRCRDCGGPAFLSPETQAILKQRGDAPTRIICDLCLRC